MIRLSYSRQNLLVEFISSLLILLFVYAAVSKLIAFQEFRVTIGQSPLLTPYASWLAWVVPLVEISISMLLVTSRFRLLGLYLSFSLMVLFTAYIAMILTYADYVPCSCGGVLEAMSWSEHLWFNGFFVLLSIVGIFLDTANDYTNYSTED